MAIGPVIVNVSLLKLYCIFYFNFIYIFYSEWIFEFIPFQFVTELILICWSCDMVLVNIPLFRQFVCSVSLLGTGNWDLKTTKNNQQHFIHHPLNKWWDMTWKVTWHSMTNDMTWRTGTTWHTNFLIFTKRHHAWEQNRFRLKVKKVRICTFGSKVIFY